MVEPSQKIKACRKPKDVLIATWQTVSVLLSLTQSGNREETTLPSVCPMSKQDIINTSRYLLVTLLRVNGYSCRERYVLSTRNFLPFHRRLILKESFCSWREEILSLKRSTPLYKNSSYREANRESQNRFPFVKMPKYAISPYTLKTWKEKNNSYLMEWLTGSVQPQDSPWLLWSVDLKIMISNIQWQRNSLKD